MHFPPRRGTMLPALITITLFITGFLLSVSITVEGNGKKSRRATAKSGKKSGKSTSSRSKTARRGISSRTTKSEPPPIASYQAAPTLPDRVEVIEYGSSESADLKKLLNMPNSSVTATSSGLDSGDLATPTRRVSVKMDSSRVFEIQQALAGKGFYQGDTTGIYDESTVDAMRRFQLKEKITVTGYPTAHALRRLGLARW